MKRRICVVVTARPSYSRVKTALASIRDHEKLDLQLVVAGSAILEKYGDAASVMEKDGFVPSARVHNVVEGPGLQSASKTTALGIIELSSVFDWLSPDIVLTVADRFETISTAIAAAYSNIPLGHIQGGEITGNIDEKVRHAITKLSDYHFVSSESARKRVISLGENHEYVFNTGCPSIDIAHQIVGREDAFDVNKIVRSYPSVGGFPDLSKGYVIVLQHPVTTEYRLAEYQVNQTLLAVQQSGLPALWFWPNVDAGSDAVSGALRRFREKNKKYNLQFMKNVDPEDFLLLLNGALCLVGNSSVGIRECSYLGVPVVNIGSRQSGRDRGRNVIDVDHNHESILEGIRVCVNSDRPERDLVYGGGRAGERIAEILACVPLIFQKRMPAQ